MPYLFWGLLSLLWCMRAVTEEAPRRFWLAALFAAAAVATKDQAYALFLLSLPLFLLLWFVSDRWPRAHAGQVLKTLLPAAIVALLLLLLVDGAITNASGFARRIAFLAGPASRDYAEYLRGPGGWLALLGDMLRYFARRLWPAAHGAGGGRAGAAFHPHQRHAAAGGRAAAAGGDLFHALLQFRGAAQRRPLPAAARACWRLSISASPPTRWPLRRRTGCGSRAGRCWR